MIYCVLFELIEIEGTVHCVYWWKFIHIYDNYLYERYVFFI